MNREYAIGVGIKNEGKERKHKLGRYPCSYNERETSFHIRSNNDKDHEYVDETQGKEARESYKRRGWTCYSFVRISLLNYTTLFFPLLSLAIDQSFCLISFYNYGLLCYMGIQCLPFVNFDISLLPHYFLFEA